ncbi:RagB/SusD family nutrient uptake outer membrane protein [Echinicola sp. 20G]|uniref:RagB/SusD family nutrient uptake outer membrane protein n=1 Tax=Echinicola sp. 20G TaxID=2781961 RepID=UPI00190FE0E7|nr:RagB/SusD family nutrient uptake outer membrane protein [Echinicola sp. 20G]
MKYLKYKFIYPMIVALAIMACNPLDLEPVDSFSDDAVWSDPNLIESYVNEIYNQAVLSYKDSGLGWGAQTDELYGNFNWTNEWIYNRGEANPDNQTSGSLNMWGDLYNTVRYCNVFFEKLDGSELVNNMQVERMMGEVYFLRALTYFELLKRFGGVPLITKVYDVNDTEFDELRSSWTDTKNFILNDIEMAEDFLPEVYEDENLGRATLGGALALKSRLLLYNASPLYNPSGELQAWIDAKNAAKAVIDLGIYSLHGDENNYNSIFTDRFNEEVILSRVYNGSYFGDRYNTFDRDMSPNGYNGYSAYNPLQQLVDDFEMADGSKFSWDNPSHAATPYANREPRFYADILFNGAMFKGREAEFFEGGLDSRTSSMSPWNASKTGYTIRKMVDEDHDFNIRVPNTTQWVVFRLGEIYLNYAEACAALGETGEAVTYLNYIRTRAGLPEVNAVGEELISAIRHERRIELCFEGHRYFDIRRWETPEIGSEDAIGILIEKEGDQFDYGFQVVQERTWVPSFVYYPIPRSEIQKNPEIDQNPFYQ